jgi:hypothetical protein
MVQYQAERAQITQPDTVPYSLFLLTFLQF